MSREGRAQPIQPFATHGFLGNVPANGVLPGRVTVVEVDDRRRRRYEPLPAVAVNGIYATIVQTVVRPPAPAFAILADRTRAAAPVQPVIEHGFVDPAAASVTPPSTTNVDRQDQHARYLPLPAISLSAALDSVIAAPTPAPPGPFVVPLDERKRFLTALQPYVIAGFDDADPPPPNVVEPDGKRSRYRQILDAISISGILGFLLPFVAPPETQSVEPGQRRRTTPDPLSISGALASFPAAPFTAPPSPYVYVPEGPRRPTPQPLFLSGALAPFLQPGFVRPPAPLVVFVDGKRRLVPQPIMMFGPAFSATVAAVIYTSLFDRGGPAGALDHAAGVGALDRDSPGISLDHASPSGALDPGVPSGGFDRSTP